MANASDYKDKSAVTLWNEEEQWVEAVYSFSDDGGATGAVDLLKLPAGYIVMDGMAHVSTACTSGGSATVEVGHAGSSAAFFAQTAVASLTEDAVIDLAAKQIVDSTNNTVKLTIATAALTAGVIKVWLKLKKA